MDKLYVPLLVMFTSLVGYYVLAIRWQVQKGDFKQALLGAVEFVGFWVLVYVANALFGLIVILSVRQLTGFFISAYILKDIMFMLFTFLQALVFWQLWNATRGR